ncbi:hypothetical protein JOQ06_021463 [Pogonophryne albipinna]|uniref:Uncharacterized protein n=1 Tax=Pogonophryne albipinna TaxID=1090488 RepID=A0AAD6A6I7_9TELE|nr:hypothetical protein JOQ06_021463 [Pogonophryne albipinna]
MYERHKRRYSLRAKGERTVDVVLLKIETCLCCLEVSFVRAKSTETERRRFISRATLNSQSDSEPLIHTGGDTLGVPLISGSSQPSEFPSLPSRTSSFPSSALRDSGSDIESLLSAEPGYDSVFRKSDDPVTGGDSTSEVSVSVSCSSTDETSSSHEGNQGLECSWIPEESIKSGAPGGGGEAEEEAKDRVTEVPRRSSILRNSIRSLSPLRRHSWGPGKNNGGDAEMNHRSSIHISGEEKPTFHRRRYR